MKKKGILLLGALIFLSNKHIQADAIDPSIPDIPNNFEGVNLKSKFHPAVGNGVIYSDDQSVLQMSNGFNQLGAVWAKNKIDLKKPFKMSSYLYMGNENSWAADGMSFSLQQYNPSLVGDSGKGIGIYSSSYPFSLALELDTYFNGDGPDRFNGPSGSNGLTQFGNHIAFAASSQNWANYQYHYGVSHLGTGGEYLSNGYWKKLDISAQPINDYQTILFYSLQDLGSGKTYANQCLVDFRSSWEDAPHQFFTTNEVYWGFTSSTGAQMEISAMTFGSLPQTPTIATRDMTIYQGEEWNPSQNFISGNDERNVEFQFSDNRLSYTNNVDTTKPGTYSVAYTYKNGSQSETASAKVTVLGDKSSIKTKDSVLCVGQSWNKESNFVGATDEDGNPVPWGDSRILSNGATVDTSKAGVTKLRYTYKGKVKNTDSEFTVTVEDPLKLVVPSSSDFGAYKLGSSNTVLPWNKTSKVEVEGATNSQWDLSVALSSNNSFENFMKIGETPITDTSQKVISGRGPMSVTDEVSPDKFIKVDYAGVKKIRKDTGTLQWTLTPSLKGVIE